MEMAYNACHLPPSICLNRKSGSLLPPLSSPSVSTPSMAHQMGIVFLFYSYIGVIYLFWECRTVDCLALFSGDCFLRLLRGKLKRNYLSLKRSAYFFTNAHTLEKFHHTKLAKIHYHYCQYAICNVLLIVFFQYDKNL